MLPIEIKDRTIRIKKRDDAKRHVYGEVYAPNELDTYGEFMTEEDIEHVAHRFMGLDLSACIDTMHDNQANGCRPIESFVVRDSDPDFAPGSWVLGVKIEDDLIWNKVLKGELNGFSMQSLVKPIEVEVRLSVIRDHVGVTEPEGTDDHEHMFFVKVDETGRVISGHTSNDSGHSHLIKRASITERTNDHAHRYFL